MNGPLLLSLSPPIPLHRIKFSPSPSNARSPSLFPDFLWRSRFNLNNSNNIIYDEIRRKKMKNRRRSGTFWRWRAQCLPPTARICPHFLSLSKLLTLSFCAGRRCRHSAVCMRLTGRTDIHFCNLPKQYHIIPLFQLIWKQLLSCQIIFPSDTLLITVRYPGWLDRISSLRFPEITCCCRPFTADFSPCQQTDGRVPWTRHWWKQ